MAAKSGTAEVVIQFKPAGQRQTVAAVVAIAKATDKAQKDADRKAAQSRRQNERAEKETERKRVTSMRAMFRELTTAARQHRRDDLREAQKNARERERTEKRAVDGAAKAAEDADKRKAVSAARYRRSFVTETRRAYREAEREAAASARRNIQLRRVNERQLAGGIALATAIGGAAMSTVSNAQGVIGVRSQEEVTRDAIASRQNLLAQVAPTGATPEQFDAFWNRVIETAAHRNVSPSETIAAVAQMQEQFSSVAGAFQGGPEAMEAFFATLDQYALASRATRDDVGNVSTAMGAFTRQFHLNAEQQREALGILYQGAQDGSLSMRDFAETMPSVIAPFITARGSSAQGTQGLREFAAIGQGLRAGDVPPELARTLTAALLTNLSDTEVQSRLAEAGLRVTDGAGNIRNIGDLVAEVARNPALQTSTQFREAFGRQEASQAFSILVNQEKTGTTLRSRELVDANRGLRSMDATATALNRDASGQATRVAVQSEASLLRSSEELIGVNTDLARRVSELQAEFPKVAMALQALSPVFGAIGLAAGAKALLPGSFGTLLGIGGGGTTAATGAGTSAAAGGGSTLLGALGLPFAAGLSLIGAGVSGWLTGETQAQENMRREGRRGRPTGTLSESLGTDGPFAPPSAETAAAWGIAQGPSAAGPRGPESGLRDLQRETQAQTRELSNGLRDVATAIRNLPTTPAGSPGNTTANGQGQ